MSIGKRPTFYNYGQLITEVYIYDFEKEYIWLRMSPVVFWKELEAKKNFPQPKN